jgi:hypothetical protein
VPNAEVLWGHRDMLRKSEQYVLIDLCLLLHQCNFSWLTSSFFLRVISPAFNLKAISSATSPSA